MWTMYVDQRIQVHSTLFYHPERDADRLVQRLTIAPPASA
jgi:hypothetical protein